MSRVWMYATEKRAVGTGISGIRGLYGWVNLLPTIVGKIFIQEKKIVLLFKMAFDFIAQAIKSILS